MTKPLVLPTGHGETRSASATVTASGHLGRRPARPLLGLLGLAALLAVLGSATLADARTGSRTRGFGHSVQGRRLEVRRTGPRHAATHVLVVGEIHGSERAGEPIVSRLRVRPAASRSGPSV